MNLGQNVLIKKLNYKIEVYVVLREQQQILFQVKMKKRRGQKKGNFIFEIKQFGIEYFQLGN